MEAFDVAVAGGGPAGCATAIRLAHGGRRVLLVEAGGAHRWRPGESAPPALPSLLQELRLPSAVLAGAHRACHGNVSAWGSDELQFTDFVHGPAGPGWQLDRARFDATLLEAARHAGVVVRCNARLRHVAATGEGHALLSEGPEGALRASARWLVDAAGRSSTLLRALGARRIPFDRLVAFSLAMQPCDGADQDGRTWIEAHAGGWWYTVLLPSGSRLFTCVGDRDLLPTATLMSVGGFVAALLQTTHMARFHAAHALVPAGRPRGSNAATTCLDRLVGERWIAVGDAAQSCDPLSAQGIASALHTALRAADAVHAAIAGDTAALHDYEAGLRRMFGAYLRHWRAAYRHERRWAAQPFWRRRQDVASLLPAGR